MKMQKKPIKSRFLALIVLEKIGFYVIKISGSYVIKVSGLCNQSFGVETVNYFVYNNILIPVIVRPFFCSSYPLMRFIAVRKSKT